MIMMIYHSNDEIPDEEPKTTSEKPVSLSPLSLNESLKGLLKIELKEDKDQKQTKNGTNQQ